MLNENYEMPVEDVEVSDETPSEEIETEETEESTENVEVDEFDEVAQKFLEKFEIQFDKNSKKFESIDQLKEAAEMGSALPRYKEKISKYEEQLNSPHYQWIDKYMKANGYDNGSDFVKAIQINEERQSLIEGGMSEELAQSKAEEIVNKTFGNQNDTKNKQIDDFLNWHQSKVEAGTFNDSMSPDNIPPEVLEKHEQGMNLKEAYMDYMLDDIKVKTEQETLKKLDKNKKTSTGELKTSPKSETGMTAPQIEAKLASMPSNERNKWISANYAMIEKSGIFN